MTPEERDEEELRLFEIVGVDEPDQIGCAELAEEREGARRE